MDSRTAKFAGFAILVAVAMLAMPLFAERQGPWTKERAWEWYRAQPWIRGCNYMPASCANRVDQWQELGCEERFAEMDRELAVAPSWRSTRCAPSSSLETTA